MPNVTLARRMAAGQCSRCAMPKEDSDGRNVCASCLRKAADTRKARVASGICRDCGGLIEGERRVTRCSVCMARYGGTSVVVVRLATARRCVQCSSAKIITQEGKRTLCQPCFFKQAACRCMGSARFWKSLEVAWNAQRGVCPYTGLLIRLGVDASVDHIKPHSRFPELRSDPANIQ